MLGCAEFGEIEGGAISKNCSELIFHIKIIALYKNTLIDVVKNATASRPLIRVGNSDWRLAGTFFQRSTRSRDA